MNEGILKDKDAIIFLIYKGIEGIATGIEEYKIYKKSGIKEKIIKKSFEEILKEYIKELPLTEKLIVKTILSLPWSETVKMISSLALSYGKKGDGEYKSTFDVIMDVLKGIR